MESSMVCRGHRLSESDSGFWAYGSCLGFRVLRARVPGGILKPHRPNLTAPST